MPVWYLQQQREGRDQQATSFERKANERKKEWEKWNRKEERQRKEKRKKNWNWDKQERNKERKLKEQKKKNRKKEELKQNEEIKQKERKEDRQTDRHSPERSPKGGEDWEGRHVIWFDHRPVVRCKSARQGHLAQSRDKVRTPEEEEDVVELQADQVLVVKGLPAVERKETLWVGALSFHCTGGEILSTDGEAQLNEAALYHQGCTDTTV